MGGHGKDSLRTSAAAKPYYHCARLMQLIKMELFLPNKHYSFIVTSIVLFKYKVGTLPLDFWWNNVLRVEQSARSARNTQRVRININRLMNTRKRCAVCISISMKGHLAAVLSTFSLLFLQSSLALNVSDITQCPKLAPRESPPANVSDLRIDDISVVGALGDR